MTENSGYLKAARLAWAGLPGLGEEIEQRASAWSARDGTARLFARDAQLFTGRGEDRWLGWLDLPATSSHALRVPESARSVLLLGMGGSSLGAEMLVQSLATGERELSVLDSTNPGTVAAALAALDPVRTVVVVASKSGGTLETRVLFEVVWQWLENSGGVSSEQLIGVTDPGSALERLVDERGGQVVHGDPEIGGRFSVLSPFGLVAAELCGVDTSRLLQQAGRALVSCRVDRPWDNPGVALGLVLAAAQRMGRWILPMATTDLGPALAPWIEQLVAESTGKGGRAVLPVVAVHPLGGGRPENELALHLLSEAPEEPGALERDGGAELRVWPVEPSDIASEIVRWQVATAVLGAEMELDPFTQPDVESAKIKTREISDEVRLLGGQPPEDVLLAIDGGDAGRGELRLPLGAETPTAAPRRELSELLLDWLEPAPTYVALLSFLPEMAPVRALFERLAAALAERTGTVCALNWGPRYLHSTGQAHKGGPLEGAFLVVTANRDRDHQIPGDTLTLGNVCDAQAIADAAVLGERGQRVLRLHLDDALVLEEVIRALEEPTDGGRRVPG